MGGSCISAGISDLEGRGGVSPVAVSIGSSELEKSHGFIDAFTMVAHFVSVLLTAFVAYTAKPGSSKFYSLGPVRRS